ncbi:hypothetical protein AM499_17335 [Bacillus sp. FJAT-22090]|uniref:DUF5677 domain-containing protein n=1 Tax=Bacillus sp. FJAT-22090 TaxID=1581038 RepID=UPI0006B06CA1|nr:DUF5677 domain-containing protein [Bacillus sp. FJAT-22090]ALC87379.1 hypothetical protein AM499_17335 [Bacillus sp. FJAT-22090]
MSKMNMDTYLYKYCEEQINIIYDELIKGNGSPEIEEIIPLLLFKNILDKISTLKVLKKKADSSIKESSQGIARVVIETQWNLMFMIEQDSKFRALSYYYLALESQLNSQITSYDYHISETQGYIEKNLDNLRLLKDNYSRLTSIKLLNDPAALKYALNKNYGINSKIEIEKKIKIREESNKELFNTIQILKNKKKEVENKLNVLKDDKKFSDVQKEITKSKQKINYPKWYNLKTNIVSLRQLAIFLGRKKQYDGVYNMFSQEIHVLNAINQIYIEDGVAKLQQSSSNVNHTQALDAFSSAMYALTEVAESFLYFYGKVDESIFLRRQMENYSKEK